MVVPMKTHSADFCGEQGTWLELSGNCQIGDLRTGAELVRFSSASCIPASVRLPRLLSRWSRGIKESSKTGQAPNLRTAHYRFLEEIKAHGQLEATWEVSPGGMNAGRAVQKLCCPQSSTASLSSHFERHVPRPLPSLRSPGDWALGGLRVSLLPICLLIKSTPIPPVTSLIILKHAVLSRALQRNRTNRVMRMRICRQASVQDMKQTIAEAGKSRISGWTAGWRPKEELRFQLEAHSLVFLF